MSLLTFIRRIKCQEPNVSLVTSPGVSSLEVLLTITILVIIAAVTMPLYRNYQIRNDLNLVTEQTIQGLRRAQMLAQNGEGDSEWGFRVHEGVLFKGPNYKERDPSFDEPYPVPPTIGTLGIEEVVYSRINGNPDVTGSITLQSLHNEERLIIVGDDGTPSVEIEPPIEPGGLGGDIGQSSVSSSSESSADVSSSLSSMVGGGTQSSFSTESSIVPSSSSFTSSFMSSSSSSIPSSSMSSVAACDDRFFVRPDGTIETTGTVNVTFTVLGSAVTYGEGGPEVQVTVKRSVNGGQTWSSLFSGADIDGGETETITDVPSGSRVLLSLRGRYQTKFDKTYVSNDGTGHIEVLRDGDNPPDYEPFDDQQSLEAFLQDILDAQGRIDIDAFDVVILTEFGSLNSSAADFQDAVVLIHFEPVGICP